MRISKLKIFAFSAVITVIGIFAEQRSAFAQNVKCSFNVAGVETLQFPSRISIPAGSVSSPVAISSWVNGTVNNKLAECFFSGKSSDGPAAGIAFESTLTPTSHIYREGGMEFIIYKTSVDGIGIVMSRMRLVGGCVHQPWGPLEYPNRFLLCSVGQIPLSSPFYLGGGVNVRLVRYPSATLPAGEIGVYQVATSYAVTRQRTGDYVNYSSSAIRTIAISPVTIVPLTCTTQDVQLDLGDHKQAVFRGVGSAVDYKRFAIKLSNCPEGIPRITYQLNATTPIWRRNSGVVALSADSTAKGIGVQIADELNIPIQFGERYRVAFDNGDSSGYHRIPLKARFYQTEGKVSPGNATVRVAFTISYE